MALTKKKLLNIASSGTVSISKWTSKFNQTIIDNPGHKEYFLNLKTCSILHLKKFFLLIEV